MPSSAWSTVVGSSNSSVVIRGPVSTQGAPPAPPGQTEAYVYGARGISAGTFALYANEANFAPISSSRSAQVTLGLRAHEGGQPFAFTSLVDNGVDEIGYMLGLDSAGRLTLAKGALADGLDEPSTILRRAVAPTPAGTWLHVRLDVVANDNGDNVLNAWTSSSGSIVSPTWDRTLDRFIDDVLASNTNTAPLRGGYVGFGAKLPTGARAYFAAVGIQRGA